jgi:Glycosyltransferase 61
MHSRMVHITLSEWAFAPGRNYYHLFVNCVRHLLDYMKIHHHTKKDTYFVIPSQIMKSAYPFFKDVLTYFVQIMEPNDIITPIVIDVKKYCDYQTMYDMLWKLQTSTPNKTIVYIKRKGRRYVTNDDACIEVLKTLYQKKYDIVVAQFEELSVKQQIDLMSGCILLVGCHGAGCSNTYFMKSDSILFELFPESFYVDCFKKICDVRSIHYFYMNGTSSRSPPITLEYYMKNLHCPQVNTPVLRASIRDIPFTINVEEFSKKLRALLPV